MVEYAEVERKQDVMCRLLEKELSILEGNLIRKRDKEECGERLPIYLTKWRMKSTDSIYLKLKRCPQASLDDIHDYGGFRILCMFDQDILPIHKYLVEYLHEQTDLSLYEFSIYSWKNKNLIGDMKAYVKSKFNDEVKIHDSEKNSGYKSLHYVLTYKNIPCIEVQLRTVLQDVWGELSHTLAYKQGCLHPHVVKSFSLLSKDLETNDLLISYLKDITKKEKAVQDFSLRNSGPYNVFLYEDGMTPNVFNESVVYEGFLELSSAPPENEVEQKGWYEECSELLNDLRDLFSGREMEEPTVKYWFKVEEAYLEFGFRRHDDSYEKYRRIIADYPQKYVPYFRAGEIEFIKGNIETALVSFDSCERNLQSLSNPSPKNEYFLKVKLANTYWLLGSEYLDTVLAKIGEAKAIYCENRSIFSEEDGLRLANNLCWYQLEDYLRYESKLDQYRSSESEGKTIEKSDMDEVEASCKGRYRMLMEVLEELESTLDSESVPSNSFDTAAWAYYNMYVRKDDPELLEKARGYCNIGWTRKNSATQKILSSNLQRGHLQEIVNA